MDIEYYEKTMRKLYEAQALIAGMEDVKNGRVKDGAAVIDGLRDKYGI